MSLRPAAIEPILQQTADVAHLAFQAKEGRRPGVGVATVQSLQRGNPG